ncbi:hypothetical protein BVRB_9g213910 [Beta vulgaris subsp. vulgaris]|nr:hypothetical protein BVRB_9g213910 [Beta vulgaris subsp. vulgaris]
MAGRRGDEKEVKAKIGWVVGAAVRIRNESLGSKLAIKTMRRHDSRS